MNTDIRELLEKGLNPTERRLLGRTISSWERAFAASPQALSKGSSVREACQSLVVFLQRSLQDDRAELSRLRRVYREFVNVYARCLSVPARQRAVLQLAKELGATPRQLRADRRAFDRWFDADCVTERFDKRAHALEFRMSHGLSRLGELIAHLFDESPDLDQQIALWRRLRLGEVLKPLFTHDGDIRVARAAVKCLDRALSSLIEVTPSVVDQGTLQFLCQTALHKGRDTWLQCHALDALPRVSPENFVRIAERRLSPTIAEGEVTFADDFFVRRHVVQRALQQVDSIPGLQELLPLALRDESSFVRQGFAQACVTSPWPVARQWLPPLAHDDPTPRVRAAAVLSLEACRETDPPWVTQQLLRRLREEEDSFVLRVAVECCAPLVAALQRHDPGSRWIHDLTCALERIHFEHAETTLRRSAAAMRERIWLITHTGARAVSDILDRLTAALDSGTTAPGSRVLSEALRAHGPDVVGRVLAVRGHDNFGFDLQVRGRRARLTRGSVFTFRWWRFLHELRNPSPDKRQAFPHTVARQFQGELRAPSMVLGELTETRVPGEPLFMSEEGGWRPYLPLPDEYLSAVASPLSGGGFKIYTSEGITEVRPPDGIWSRLRASGKLTWNFAHYAQLRNWRARSKQQPDYYLKSLEELGFQTRLLPHADSPSTIDPRVQRFFPAILPFAHESWWYDIHEYIMSLYENSLADLILFASVASAGFLGQQWRTHHSFKRARAQLPLVIGGWGTRGKSGSERLKAALISALGYSVVSKTTGCEAMFLYGHAFGNIQELFLFRPYDKATIWEQASIVRLAAKLEADVFLWECMGLNPEYVSILQREWMRDDLATLTNAYPDHEDLQGPAGFNIPEAMTHFIPEASSLITTEEHMLPILAEDARRKGTSIRKVSWIEAGLLTDDVLQRFPYEEHPNNVAMIVALGRELGVAEEFTLKAMADHVVPDLGVLKVYPPANVEGRYLQFTNGTSANDRHGALGNYHRLGFHEQERETDAAIWKTTVVNNRADRVPRSRVFAQILVEDITADRHYLIGGNLNGLVGFIREAWEAYARDLTLWPEHGNEAPHQILQREARRKRIPLHPHELRQRLRGMCGSEATVIGEAVGDAIDDPLQRAVVTSLEQAIEQHWEQPDALECRLREIAESNDTVTLDVVAVGVHHRRELTALQEYQQLLATIDPGNTTRPPTQRERTEIDSRLRQQLWKWFERTIVVISDPLISGENLVRFIALDTPPSYLNRVLGLQNIKGTGLDFVYRWQAWEACHSACDALTAKDTQKVAGGLRFLTSFREYGYLSERHVQACLEQLGNSPQAQSESTQAEMALIRSHVDEALARLRKQETNSTSRDGWIHKVINAAEAFLDPGDSVRRRKTADRIYRDLVAERISSSRAAIELKKLTQRQKGGWLAQKLSKLTPGGGA